MQVVACHAAAALCVGRGAAPLLSGGELGARSRRWHYSLFHSQARRANVEKPSLDVSPAELALASERQLAFVAASRISEYRANRLAIRLRSTVRSSSCDTS